MNLGLSERIGVRARRVAVNFVGKQIVTLGRAKSSATHSCYTNTTQAAVLLQSTLAPATFKPKSSPGPTPQ
ncbi:uncharacterized [Tachysurus ichikawai]